LPGRSVCSSSVEVAGGALVSEELDVDDAFDAGGAAGADGAAFLAPFHANVSFDMCTAVPINDLPSEVTWKTPFPAASRPGWTYVKFNVVDGNIALP